MPVANGNKVLPDKGKRAMPQKRRWHVIPQSVCDRAHGMHLNGMRQKDIAARLNICQSEISAMKKRGWKQAIGGHFRTKRMPENFPVMAKRFTHAELCRHYAVGSRVIARWKNQLHDKPRSRRGDHFRGKRKPRSMPKDFAEKSAVMTVTELRRHYAAGGEAIQRWFGELPNRRPKWNGRNRPT